jgi:hypothetical protein
MRRELPIRAALVLLASLAAAHCAHRPSDPLPGFPRTVLWAWERPENLAFIDVNATGVAFWAGTIFLRGDEAVLHPRLQGLTLPEGAAKILVVRLDSAHGPRATLSAAQRSAAVARLADLAAWPGIRALQIDFDAGVSERSFYRTLLQELRPRLPPGLPLAITALASWCLDDPWIRDLPVDEAVPMIFSLGAEDRAIRARLERRTEFTVPACRNSLGLSANEPLPRLPRGRRRYYFSAQPWRKDLADGLAREEP